MWVFVSFCTVNKEKEEVGLHQLGEYMLTQEPIAHNPLTWLWNDGTEAPMERHLGSIGAHPWHRNLYTSSRGGFVSAMATKEGALRIDDKTYRAYTQALEDIGGEYHSMEINLFWPNLRENVRQRAEARQQRTGAP